MALDLLDRKLLYELDLDSRAPIAHIAKRLRVSKETANFRLKRLVRNGYIKGFVTTINTSQLNRYYYKIFYKFHKTTAQVDAAIAKHIGTHKNTAWFGTFEGPYNLAFLIIAESIYDLDSFLQDFRFKFGDYVLEQEIHVLTSVHRFNLKFFHKDARILHTQYPNTLVEPDVDPLDYALIRDLASNARVSALEMSKRHNVDVGTVIYRYRKLKKQQILGNHVLAVNFDTFGMQHFQINFKLVNQSSIEAIIDYFSRQDNATFATVALGKYDLAIELVVPTVQELATIVNDAKKHFVDQVVDHDTFLITKEYNVTWYPS